MKRLVFCIIAVLTLSFSAQQADAQRLYEGSYYLEFNGQLMAGHEIWQVDLPTKYYPIDITVKAYKVVNGSLVEVSWDVNQNFAGELNKTKIGKNTLRLSFKLNNGNWGCAVALDVDGNTDGIHHFWVNLPPDSY